MTSGEEIVPRFITSGNQCFCPEESKPAIPALTWLSGKARMAGTACLATLSQPAVGPLLIACVCLATLAYKKRNCPKPVNNNACAAAVQEALKKRPALLHRSMSIAALHGGKATLERILDAQQARIDKEGLDGEVDKMNKIISEPRVHFMDLHRAATKLEMSGKEDKAIEILRKELGKAQKNNQPLEAYEFEMLLVEMLIYKEAFDEALNCKCLTETDISDARIPLYKAIIYTMKNEKENAKKFYEEFQSICQMFHWFDGIKEGSPLYGIVLHFDKFEEIVENLNKEIDHAHKLRAAGKL
ncbi:uncharacterized protein LOC144559845 isoform X2 [Carex rostrata]